MVARPPAFLRHGWFRSDEVALAIADAPAADDVQQRMERGVTSPAASTSWPLDECEVEPSREPDGRELDGVQLGRACRPPAPRWRPSGSGSDKAGRHEQLARLA